MDKLKSILAKYWVGILCAIVAIAAIVAAFWPLGDYHDQLYKKMQASAANATTASNLLTKTRMLPQAPGQPAPLELKMFPSASIIKSGEALRDKLNASSLEAFKVVVDLNRHQPLLAGVLPNPQGVGPLDFRTAYNNRVGAMGSIYMDILHAGQPPTADDIKNESDRIKETKYKPLIVADAAGHAMNQDSVMAQFDAENALLPQKMRQDRAFGCKVYVANDAMPIDPVVSAVAGLPPDPRKIWWSQMTLWVEEDIAKAIAEANKNARNVTESPVKRLLKLDMGQDAAMIFKSTAPPAGATPTLDANGVPVLTADANVAVPNDVKLSPSGRVSCNLYDVIQFKVDMVVAAKDLPWITECFARNQLMSVLNIESLYAEDVIGADHDGYFYGPNPVVHVTLKCELLYMREWTIPLMPDTIKRMIATGAAAPQG